MKLPPASARFAFTLAELVAVMTILTLLAGIVVFEIGNFQEKADIVTTQTSLGIVRDAITGNSTGQGYQQDMHSFASAQPILYLPTTLAALYSLPTGAPVYGPYTKLGWNGPYLTSGTGVYQINAADGFTTTYGAANDPAPLDAWKHPIVLQIPSDPTYARLVSAGPDGKIQTPLTELDPPLKDRGDDVVLFLLRPDIPATP